LHADVALSDDFTYPSDPADGVTVASATALAFADVETDLNTNASVVATFTLYASDGVTVAASAAAPAVVVSPGSVSTATALLSLNSAECWSVARPYLYTLTVSLTVGGSLLDTLNATLGVRSVRWDADYGAFVNEQRVRFRAYCDHESFAAVGMAVPPRVNLFRFQAMRGMGGNGRRFSHNPPTPVLLDLADRLGIMTLDENRVFSPGLAPNMVDLVTRDRNHPSVVFWSFCNEPGCNFANKSAPTQPTQDFKYAVEQNDGTRAVTGNMCIDCACSRHLRCAHAVLSNVKCLSVCRGFLP
jgi:beta-galactosidase/beta-glucuronidase